MKKTIFSEQGKLIAERLAEIRGKSGMTQRGLAEKLKREHSFVAHCELGERRVDLAEFYWICEACGVAADKEAAKLMKEFKKIEA